MTAPTLFVDTWFDYICPLSYLQQTILRRLSEIYGTDVQVRFRAFDLIEASNHESVSVIDEINKDWETVVTPLAQELDVTINKPAFVANSFHAFAIAHRADQDGVFGAYHRAVFDAYFVDGEDIGTSEVLTRIASLSGLTKSAIASVLDRKAHSSTVRNHLEVARKLGIRGLPYTLVSRKQGAGSQARPIELRGVTPLKQLHSAIKLLFPDGFSAKAPA